MILSNKCFSFVLTKLNTYLLFFFTSFMQVFDMINLSNHFQVKISRKQISIKVFCLQVLLLLTTANPILHQTKPPTQNPPKSESGKTATIVILWGLRQVVAVRRNPPAKQVIVTGQLMIILESLAALLDGRTAAPNRHLRRPTISRRARRSHSFCPTWLISGKCSRLLALGLSRKVQ